MQLCLVDFMHPSLTRVYALCSAFYAASPEVQQAVLEFHAPVDGPRAAELRTLIRGAEDVVEQCVKVRGGVIAAG